MTLLSNVDVDGKSLNCCLANSSPLTTILCLCLSHNHRKTADSLAFQLIVVFYFKSRFWGTVGVIVTQWHTVGWLMSLLDQSECTFQSVLRLVSHGSSNVCYVFFVPTFLTPESNVVFSQNNNNNNKTQQLATTIARQSTVAYSCHFSN